ncbi:MAG: hypothetical protein KF884_06960 [Fimbriimonadaceae bacterium]|nr:hypothetical protein [Fimbriimonadaceae bacterium]QYK57289.1 MAG: hypothetical protein KF884_06960 [Fimbriimonadaceae bacterium]
MEKPKTRKPRQWAWIAVVATALVLGVVFVAPVLSVVNDFVRAGFFRGQDKATYTGGSEDNLRAIHRSLKLYADSEGALPPADRWMDEAWIRLQTRDLPQEEAKKKLQAPGAALGEYGYAFNSALAGKHPEDVPDGATPMVFESADKTWNAHGTSVPQGALAVTVAGEIVRR